MLKNNKKIVHLSYYALLREQSGKSKETIQTSALTAQDLYIELSKTYKFDMPVQILRLAINNEFKNWQTKLKSNDEIIFIPPVAGG